MEDSSADFKKHPEVKKLSFVASKLNFKHSLKLISTQDGICLIICPHIIIIIISFFYENDCCE